MVTYETLGSVRGSCHHRHRTLEAAIACIERDRRACRALPGGTSYSDRDEIIGSDGSSYVEIYVDGGDVAEWTNRHSLD